MIAGSRNHFFHIYQPAESGGDAVAADVKVGEVWGSLEGLTSTNRGELTNVLEYRIETDWHPELHEPHYLVDQGDSRRFGILSATDPAGRRRALSVLAEVLG
jgi:hypothetical protein